MQNTDFIFLTENSISTSASEAGFTYTKLGAQSITQKSKNLNFNDDHPAKTIKLISYQKMGSSQMLSDYSQNSLPQVSHGPFNSEDMGKPFSPPHPFTNSPHACSISLNGRMFNSQKAESFSIHDQENSQKADFKRRSFNSTFNIAFSKGLEKNSPLKTSKPKSPFTNLQSPG
jgi:hypothetical protein